MRYLQDTKHILEANYYKELTGGKSGCISEIFEAVAENSSDSESDAVEDNWWTKSNKKTCQHKAEKCWNNSNKTKAWISLLIHIR